MIATLDASVIFTCGSSSSHGSSATADFIAKLLERQRKHTRESRTAGIYGRDALYNLYQTFISSREPNWDGYGALPVSNMTFRLAKQFLNCLPLGTPEPSFGTEPDGHITFEWHKSLRKTLSVSVSPDCELHFAALIGENKTYGTEIFYGELPKIILDLIFRVTEA